MAHILDTSNEDLLKDYQLANPRACEAFFLRNYKIVFNFLMMRLKNRRDAETALQKTFLQVHKSILTYDPAQKALAWVFAIAEEVTLDTLNHRSRDQQYLADQPRERSQANTLAMEARDSLMKLIAGLADADRDLLAARFISSQ